MDTYDVKLDATPESLIFELKKKNEILKELNTFLVQYNYKTGQLYIDPLKDKMIAVPWDKTDIIARINLEKIIFRPDIPEAMEFLDFENVRIDDEYLGKCITLRLFVAPHKYKWFRAKQILFLDDNGNRQELVIAFTNADSDTETEQNLKFRSEKDTLTCLPNKNAFYQKVSELTQNNPYGKYQIIRMDIDGFRMVNEMFGDKEGDKLLKYIGVRIQECLDEEDQVAYCRASADAFLMCVPERLYSVQGIIEFLRRSIVAYPSNYEIQLAFGVYDITKADIDGLVPISTLVDRATAAQATVKGSYINHIAYYDEGLAAKEKSERTVLADMHEAVLSEEIEVFLQPKVDMTNGKIVGAEALSRWIHPVKGLIMPNDFVPVFEKNGFIIEIDDYVTKHTCMIIRDWIDRGIKTYPVSVNLSRANLFNPQLLSNIEKWVEQYKVPRDLLEFELTETIFATDNLHLARLAKKLQKNGFKVYMDDFGSGYSSLNVLKDISINVIKVDMKFLPIDKSDVRATTILKYVAKMANELGIDLVVEGVERKEQVEYLLENGYKIGQGYYYYKPMSVGNYEKAIMEDN